MKKIILITLLFVCAAKVFSQNFQTKLLAELDSQVSDEHSQALFGFDAQETSFFAIDGGSKLTVWETSSLKQKYSLNGKYNVAAFSPDGKWLAVSAKKKILILDAKTGKTHADFDQYREEIRFLGWNPNSENFAVAAQNFKVDVLSAKTGKLAGSLTIHEKKKGFLGNLDNSADFLWIEAKFSPDGTKILTNCRDSTAELWDLETGKRLYSFSLNPASPYQGAAPVAPDIYYAEISSDNKWILTGSYDQNIVREVETGKVVREFSGYSRPVFSPNSSFLGMVTAPDAKQRATAVFDLPAREFIVFSKEYAGEIKSWSLDNRFFITDRTTDERSKNAAIVRETKTGNEKANLKTYSKGCFDLVSTCLSDFDSYTFSADSRILMVQNKKQVKFLNVESSQIIGILENSAAPALLSLQGNYIAAKSSQKGKIKIWQVFY